MVDKAAGKRARYVTSIAVLAAYGTLATAIAVQEPSALPAMEYRVALEEGEDRPLLRVHLDARGWTATEPIRLHLDDWGEWTSRPEYVVGLESTPPARRDATDPSSLVVDVPAGWDGRLAMSYTIPVGDARGLLPWTDGECTSIYTNNVLVDLPGWSGPRRVTITAPADKTIVSGWAGTSQGTQTVELDHAIDTSPVVIGPVRASSRDEKDGIVFEVVQLGTGPDLTGSVLRIAESVVVGYARNTGRAPDEPVRIIMLETASGGTHTDHGCLVGYDPGEDPEHPSPWFAHFLAHELFHDWLGSSSFLEGSETITWFHEGFTDYLSLWHLASAGTVSPEWMAERLTDLEEEVRRSGAVGNVAFADTAGGWRDGDGPRETLAYKGGAILALAIDAELRAAERPGLLQLLTDLAGTVEGEVRLEDVRAWMEEHGLADFYGQFVARPELPDGAAILAALGFETVESDVELTYLGIRLEAGPDLGRVAEIDPHGPAAGLDVAVGDSILGYHPSRTNRPRVDASVRTRFLFGLDCIEPGRSGTYIDVRRGEDDIHVPITPRLVRGGRISRFQADVDRVDEFLEYERAE